MKLFQFNEVLVTGTKIIASNELMIPPNRACSNHSAVGGRTREVLNRPEMGVGEAAIIPRVTVQWQHKVKTNF